MLCCAMPGLLPAMFALNLFWSAKVIGNVAKRAARLRGRDDDPKSQ
jgi:hypothetical protein